MPRPRELVEDLVVLQAVAPGGKEFYVPGEGGWVAGNIYDPFR